MKKAGNFKLYCWLALFASVTGALGNQDDQLYEVCEAPDDKVCVTVSTESLDPCSPQWVFDFLNNVIPAVGDIIELRRYLDGTALPPGEACLLEKPMSFHVCTFHGAVERQVNTYEACVQYYAAQAGMTDRGHRASLEYTYCTNGQCTGPGTGCLGLDFCEYTSSLLSPEGLERSEACVREINSTLDWYEIQECARGVQGESLHWESSKYLNDIGLTFGLTGLPPVLINGRVFSCFFDCDSHVSQLQPLIEAICDEYKGTNPPAACQGLSVKGSWRDIAPSVFSRAKNVITHLASWKF